MNVRVPVISRLHAKLALDAGRLFIKFVRKSSSDWERPEAVHNAKRNLLPPEGGGTKAIRVCGPALAGLLRRCEFHWEDMLVPVPFVIFLYLINGY